MPSRNIWIPPDIDELVVRERTEQNCSYSRVVQDALRNHLDTPTGVSFPLYTAPILEDHEQRIAEAERKIAEIEKATGREY